MIIIVNKYENFSNDSQERSVVLQFTSFIMLTFLIVQQSIAFILQRSNSQLRSIENKKTERKREFHSSKIKSKQ